MNLEVIEDGMGTLNLILLIAGLITELNTYAAVRGSHQRYVAASRWVAISTAGLILALARGPILLLESNAWSTFVAFYFVLFWAWKLKRAIDEDNWFNNQLKRAKRGLKKLRERTSSLGARLLPSPTPA